VVARLRELQERAAASLFVVPMAFVLLGALLATALLAVDDALDDVELPVTVASTVDASRAVLSVVASATMAFAGIAFSVALLVVQMASSQYSPRVVQGLFRDTFNKRVMGLVVGTFTYCLVVLRSVHGNIDGGPSSVVPTISVTVAVVLGIATVLAIVGFIDHNAHRMDVSEILQDVTCNARKGISVWPDAGTDVGPAPLPPDIPTGPGNTATASRDGWLQRVEVDLILDALPAGATARLETAPGRFVVEGTTLVSVWPSDALDEQLRGGLRRSVVIGDARTLGHDPGYGIRQLVDVALRALSPGVNDPTTAQDAIFHMAALLHAMLVRDVPVRSHAGSDGRRVLLPHLPSHADLLDLAFGELGLVAASHPVVCTYLLEAIWLAGEGLQPEQRRDQDLLAQLDGQAKRVRDAGVNSGLAEREIARVESAYRERFPRVSTELSL
jgi:uncharacterized membrane protein